MKYLTIDAEINRTGIRDTYEGTDILPSELNIEEAWEARFMKWRSLYQEQHYGSFSNKEAIRNLDLIGLTLSRELAVMLPECKIQYVSAATLEQISIK